MLSKGFKIVSPKTFEFDIENIEATLDNVIVKIDYLAICKADLRYYLGTRDKKILGLKYPMRLIHEATGIVLKDNNNEFYPGEKVVLVPNICNCTKCIFKDKKYFIGSNYCPKAKFASSNYDGFSTECIAYPRKNIISYNNKKIKSEIAVFSELISVALAAIRRVNIKDKKIIAVWGDGILGYILCLVLKNISSNIKVIAIGKHKEKLEMFSADEVYLSKDKNLKELKIDLAFEAIGGRASEEGINEIIDVIDFGGDIVLTGVSEDYIKINTRKILEKAVRITGSTRSTIEDFKKAINLLEDLNFSKAINKLVLSIFEVSSITDWYKIFDLEASNKKLGKNILTLKI